MRTTVRLDDGLLDQAKAEARKKKKTLTSLIEEGLRLVLSNGGTSARRQKIILPVSRECGGVLPGVDLDNNAALLDVMENRH
ncbi:MAG TPA: hypothetical protein VGL82_18485 [Bryobacteraceae bacterium]|jgi:hypothetical protein